MRKHLIILLVISISVFTACAHGRKATRKKTKTTTAKSVKGLTAVSMQRGACFGRCPEYTLTINSNGMAEYKGARNADPMGVYQKNIGAAKAQGLLKEFMDNRVDTCSARYTANIADMPGLYYILTINGKQKKINEANFGPPFLLDLSFQMDAIAKVDASWKKVSDKVPEESR